MGEHFPALLIVVPLMAAPVAVVLRHKTAAWALATLVSWACLGMAWALTAQVVDTGPISYHLGGFEPPYGIEYRLDTVNSFMAVIICAIAAVVLPYAKRSAEAEIGERLHLFYAAFLLCMTGLMGIAVTGDAFNIFVFLEISSLSSYVLIGLGRDRRALHAALSYLIIGTIGGTFILIGIGLLYMATGTLNILDIAGYLPEVATSRTVLAAFAFFSVGISIKLALFPLHQWLPNAYTYAPSAVSAFIAATATKVSLYVLIRVIFTIFGVGVAVATLGIERILLPLAIAAMFVASTVAIFQTNLKRLLAYSSLAQIGYMALGVSLMNVEGLAGGIVHMFNHAVTKGAMFLALGCVFYRLGTVDIRDLRGLGYRMPWTTAAFVAGGLSLIGVPMTVGFVSKWYLVAGALAHGWWLVALLILLSSLLAVVYVGKVVEVAYLSKPAEGAPAVPEAPLSMLIPTWVLIGVVFVFGLWSGPTASTALHAARELFGVLP